MVYYRKIVWFGKFWLDCPKYHLWGIFVTQFLSKNTYFISKILKMFKNKDFWNSPCFKHIKGQWISKIFIFQYFWILRQNLYFLTKNEWEKCPISDILDNPTKIFQIRQFCELIYVVNELVSNKKFTYARSLLSIGLLLSVLTVPRLESVMYC